MQEEEKHGKRRARVDHKEPRGFLGVSPMEIHKNS
jgi:hypothetical protein